MKEEKVLKERCENLLSFDRVKRDPECVFVGSSSQVNEWYVQYGHEKC